MEQREMKEHQLSNYRSEMNGRSTVDVHCPYCGATIRAFVWSLSGGGKKCSCGALHIYALTFAPALKKTKVTK